jgi:hypothetical protein
VPAPDLVNTAWRDYGNRVGAFRILDMLAGLGIPPTVLDGHYEALSFLSEGGFRFFLPAYLVADVRDQLVTADPGFHLTHGSHSASVTTPDSARPSTTALIVLRLSPSSVASVARVVGPSTCSRRSSAARWRRTRTRLRVRAGDPVGADRLASGPAPPPWPIRSGF